MSLVLVGSLFPLGKEEGEGEVKELLQIFIDS